MESQTDSQRVLIDNLRRHVDRLAGIIGPRHIGLPHALAAAATLVEREFVSGDIRWSGRRIWPAGKR